VNEETFPATWDGGHALIVEVGDEELHGRCQCGARFGPPINSSESADVLAHRWERHVMTEVRA
jgi:hypothetical protein